MEEDRDIEIQIFGFELFKLREKYWKRMELADQRGYPKLERIYREVACICDDTIDWFNDHTDL